MVRAAATGAIDFAHADPFDSWWWRRLHWTLEEIEEQHRRQLLAQQHMHWVTLISSGNLTQEGLDTAWANALTLINRLMAAHFPWMKNLIDTDVQTEREALIQEFRDEYGYPGDPGYDEMVQDLLDAMNRETSNIRPKLN